MGRSLPSPIRLSSPKVFRIGGLSLVRAAAHSRRFGIRSALGQWVQTTAETWITHAPTRCPNRHPLGPNQVLVGHVACLGYGPASPDLEAADGG
jgi:hypothetical protein